jgi:transcriptional regulator with GAF, ATPase, and Fis domain
MGLLARAIEISEADRDTGAREGGGGDEGSFFPGEDVVTFEAEDLEDAEGEGEPPGGLLARATRLTRKQGLLARGERLAGVQSPAGGEGLLAKAVRMRGRGPGLLARAETLREAVGKDEVSSPLTGMISEIEEEAPGAGIITAEPIEPVVPSGGEIETEPEPPGETGEKERAPGENYLEPLEEHVHSKNSYDLMILLSRVIAEEGQDYFVEFLVESFARVTGAPQVLLFTPHRERFELECRVDRDGGAEATPAGKTPGGKRWIGKKSSLIAKLEPHRILTSKTTREEGILEVMWDVGDFDAWTAVPLLFGDDLTGVIICGNLDTVEEEHVLLLARLGGLYLSSYVIERNLQESVDRLIEEKKELNTLLDLYDYAGVSAVDLEGVLAAVSENLELETAAITVHWKERGGVEVCASVGISEKGLKKYRISKSHRDVKAAIREGKPTVLDDFDSWVARFPDEDKKRMTTAVAVPVSFNDRLLAVLMVHRMRGIGRKVSGHGAKVLHNIAQSLVPFILHRRMMELEPFDALESMLEREASGAKKSRSQLHIVAFRIKNYKNILKNLGFRKYRQRLDRFQAQIEKSAGNATVQTISLNKVVLLLREKDPEAAEERIRKVKDAIAKLLDRDKTGTPLSYSPLRTIYPNDSRSVAEIIELID